MRLRGKVCKDLQDEKTTLEDMAIVFGLPFKGMLCQRGDLPTPLCSDILKVRVVRRSDL